MSILRYKTPSFPIVSLSHSYSNRWTVLVSSLTLCVEGLLPVITSCATLLIAGSISWAFLRSTSRTPSSSLLSTSSSLGESVSDVSHVRSPLACNCAEEITACRTSLFVSSLHICVYSSQSNGMRESESASTLDLPGLYLTLNVKSASSPIHRRLAALSFAVVRTYVRGLLSVYTVNSGL